MAPSRSRTSRVSQPPGSQATARRPDADRILARQMHSERPAYTPPEYPLSESSLRLISQLKGRYERKRLDQKCKRAIGMLGNCIYDLNRKLAENESRLEKEEQKGEEANEAKLERLRGEVDDLKGKMERLPGRMEKHARLCVDMEMRWNVLLRVVDRSAEVGAGPGIIRRGTQSSGMGSSFEPTMPGATAEGDDDAGSVVGVSVLDNYRQTRQAEMNRWASMSLLERYGNHDDYKDFKAAEFEGYHGDEVEGPPPARWFETEEPPPGTTTQGAAEESDDDIQVAKAKISTKCPLTLVEFVNPVMSRTCKHAFEKAAILEMLGRGGAQKQCPVPGCPHMISRSQLTDDEMLIRKIKRIQQGRSRAHQVSVMDEDRLHTGRNADTSILLSDGVDDFAELAVDPKSEPATQPQRASATQYDTMNLDDEDNSGDDETEDEE